jgi:hypothetical protein
MKYLMLIKHSESYRAEPIPQGLLDAMDKFISKSFESGVLKDTAGLRPTSEGFAVRLKKGKLNVTDGPFTEAKEVIGGFAVIEAESSDDAREMAQDFMDLHRVHWPTFEGECEVRAFDGP